MMYPWWTWAPYWRVFSPGLFLGILPTFLYLLVFYRRAFLLIGFCVMAGLFIAFALVCQIFLIVDWNQCGDTLWCPCVTDWTVVGGVVTMTFCTTASNQASQFIAHFFLQLSMIGTAGLMILTSVWIFFQYYYRNEAYEANNPRRNIAYSNINNEAMEGGYMNVPQSPPKQKKHPHLHNVTPGKWA